MNLSVMNRVKLKSNSPAQKAGSGPGALMSYMRLLIKYVALFADVHQGVSKEGNSYGVNAYVRQRLLLS